MGCRKGQMFLISMVFLVGLIFTVQTALLGYTSVDISEPGDKTDRFLIENVIGLINDTLNDPNTEYCNSGKDNFLDKLREIQTIIKEEYVRGLFSLKIIPLLDCTKWDDEGEVVLNVTVISQGPDFDTKGLFELKRIRNIPPVDLEISDYWCNAGDQINADLNMINTRGIKVATTNITFDENVIDLLDNRTTARSSGMVFMSSNGTDWVFPVLFSIDDQIDPGQGSILEMTFRCVADGYTRLGMTEPIAMDENGDSILVVETNGSVTVGGTPPEQSLTLNIPNGGEECYIGGTCLISWSSRNAGNDVTIELLRAGIPQDPEIETSHPNNEGSNTYTWSVPGTIAEGSDYSIRVLSNDYVLLSDQSNLYFTIVPEPSRSITVTSPNGGETYNKGETRTITWSSSGITGNVKIDLLKGGSNEMTLVTSTSNDGSYSWTVPGSLADGSDYSIKITSLSYTTVSDVSNNYFTITTPVSRSITVTSPNGGETCNIGETCPITWNSQNAGTSVRIDLARGGSVASVIQSSAVNSGSYSWTVPSTVTPASDYTVRVTSIQYPTVSDHSNGAFTVSSPSQRSITVTIPNGGESYNFGQNVQITWTSQNVPGNVKIDLYYGSNFESTISASTANDGVFDWTVPASGLTESNNYYIRVTSILYPAVFDRSDSDFTLQNVVVTRSINVYQPYSGSTCTIGQDCNIRWTSQNAGNYVKIEYIRVSGTPVTISSSTFNDGSYLWNPDGSVSSGNDYRIRVTSVPYPATTDDSDVFNIAESPYITVSAPNSGTTCTLGNQCTISWGSRNVGNTVKMELYKGGVKSSDILASYTLSGSGTDSYVWNVPETLTAGTDYKIRIISISNPVVYDDSEQFSVSGVNPTLQVTIDQLNFVTTQGNYPPNQGFIIMDDTNGGLSWTITDDKSWISVSSPLSSYGTASKTVVIIGSDPSLTVGTHTGTITINSNGGTHTIGVEVIVNPVQQESTMTVTRPDGGENWDMGQSYDVQWTSTNGGSNVKIELLYSSQLYGPYNQIASSTPNDGTFTWTIPPNLFPGYTYGVRITDLDTNAQDASDGHFALIAHPILQVSPSSLTFSTDQPGNNPPPQPLTVTNGGTGTVLYWHAQLDTDNGGSWLSSSIGTSTGPGTTQISVNTAGLSVGTYTGTVTIVCTNAESGSPQIIPVTLNIGGTNPFLELSTDFIPFACPVGGPDPGVKTFDISNINPLYTGTMDWSISTSTTDGTNWLITSRQSGTLDQNSNPTTIGIVPSPTYYSKNAGKYDGTVTVTAPSTDGSPQDIDVKLYITSQDYSLIAVDREGNPGSTVSIPIYLRNMGLPLSYMYVELVTESSVLPYADSEVVFVEDMLSGMDDKIYSTTRGHVWFRIRSFDGNGRILSGEGPVAYINYVVSPYSTAGQTSPMDFYFLTHLKDDQENYFYDYDQINGVFTVV
ncbi:MAG: hypothetical protein JW754_03585 [Candidatus Aenigmarchaeota archaeon]|nr:hypothetical protein [Candidatus Aenigmarchaeota archaeon]